jgi:hypothetical protein
VTLIHIGMSMEGNLYQQVDMGNSIGLFFVVGVCGSNTRWGFTHAGVCGSNTRWGFTHAISILVNSACLCNYFGVCTE